MTYLYQKPHADGIVKRQDGYWWIHGEELISMDDKAGERLMRVINTEKLNRVAGHLTQSANKYMWPYIFAEIKYRASSIYSRFVDRVARRVAR